MDTEYRFERLYAYYYNNGEEITNAYAPVGNFKAYSGSYSTTLHSWDPNLPAIGNPISVEAYTLLCDVKSAYLYTTVYVQAINSG